MLELPESGLSFFATSVENVVISSVKKAYDQDDAFIIRFYEAEGIEGDVEIQCFEDIV